MDIQKIIDDYVATPGFQQKYSHLTRGRQEVAAYSLLEIIWEMDANFIRALDDEPLYESARESLKALGRWYEQKYPQPKRIPEITF